MSIKEQLSKLPDDMLKKGLLKRILKDVDVSDEKYQNSFKEPYKVCPKGAISIEVEDPEYLEKYIAKVESIVDVTDQTIKT